METEKSLPYSQEPATCSYTEPDQSSLSPIQPLANPYTYYSPIYASVLIPSGFPPEPFVQLSSLLYVLHALPSHCSSLD